MSALGRLFAVGALCLAWVCPVAAEKPPEKATAKLEIRRAEKEPAEGLTEATVEGSKEKVYLHKTAEITNADIAEARATEDTTGKPAVAITLTKEGAAKMRALTEKQKDKPLAILVDGKVIAAPVVKAPIGEQAWITGKFTKEEVDKLVKGINTK
jgi:preprotein translocase subunit SecD